MYKKCTFSYSCMENLLHCEPLLSCKTWKSEREDFMTARIEFQAIIRGHRQGPIRYTYPEHLAQPFPSFAKWLHCHVHTLLEDKFPEIPEELIALHYHPSNVALSFGAMWAYGYHYMCAPNSGLQATLPMTMALL